VDAGLFRWKAGLRPLLIPLFLTIVLLFPVEVAGNIILERFFPWKLVKENGLYSRRSPMANIVFFLPLIPAFIGSYMVKPIYQPFGVLGTTIGSTLFVFIWEVYYIPYRLERFYFEMFHRHLFIGLLLCGEFMTGDFLNYFLIGLTMGILGWFVRAPKDFLKSIVRGWRRYTGLKS